MLSIYKDFDEYKAKKIKYLGKEVKVNLPKAYIERNIKNYNFTNSFTKKTEKINSTIPKFSLKPTNKNQYVKNTEVVVKITSKSKNFNSINKHIDYITRNGKIDFYLPTNEVDKEQVEYRIGLSAGKEITAPTDPEIRHLVKSQYNNFMDKNDEKSLTYNMIFSMKDYAGVNEFSFEPQIVRKAAIHTIEKHYPNNFFVAALHTDTNNPHCHICLKIRDNNGKRIDIRKYDLIKIRQTFANELCKRDVEATATLKKDRPFNKNKEIDRSNYPYDIESNSSFKIFSLHENKRTKAVKNSCFEIVDFGEKKYKESDKKGTFFITYQTKDYKPITIWGKDLKRLVSEHNLKKGSFAKFQQIGTVYEQKSRQIHKDKNLFNVIEHIPIKKWDCIVYNADTNTLSKDKFDEKLPNMKQPETKINFIKELTKDEYDGRPNTLTNKYTRKYTRQQWAIYNANRTKHKSIQREFSLCLASNIATSPAKSPRNFTAIANYMRTVSAEHLDIDKQPRTKLLLSSNAQSNIPTQSATISEPVRPANTRDRGIPSQPAIQTAKRIKCDIENSIQPTTPAKRIEKERER